MSQAQKLKCQLRQAEDAFDTDVLDIIQIGSRDLSISFQTNNSYGRTLEVFSMKHRLRGAEEEHTGAFLEATDGDVMTILLKSTRSFAVRMHIDNHNVRTGEYYRNFDSAAGVDQDGFFILQDHATGDIDIPLSLNGLFSGEMVSSYDTNIWPLQAPKGALLRIEIVPLKTDEWADANWGNDDQSSEWDGNFRQKPLNLDFGPGRQLGGSDTLLTPEERRLKTFEASEGRRVARLGKAPGTRESGREGLALRKSRRNDQLARVNDSLMKKLNPKDEKMITRPVVSDNSRMIAVLDSPDVDDGTEGVKLAEDTKEKEKLQEDGKESECVKLAEDLDEKPQEDDEISQGVTLENDLEKKTQIEADEQFARELARHLDLYGTSPPSKEKVAVEAVRDKNIDTNETLEWDVASTAVLNVHIFDADTFNLLKEKNNSYDGYNMTDKSEVVLTYPGMERVVYRY